MSPQQELMEDLMAVIHTFSCRLYGMRKYKKELEEIIGGRVALEPKTGLRIDKSSRTFSWRGFHDL
jgi:hypothetical protein